MTAVQREQSEQEMQTFTGSEMHHNGLFSVCRNVILYFLCVKMKSEAPR